MDSKKHLKYLVCACVHCLLINIQGDAFDADEEGNGQIGINMTDTMIRAVGLTPNKVLLLFISSFCICL